jgi:hypothetical protein
LLFVALKFVAGDLAEASFKLDVLGARLLLEILLSDVCFWKNNQGYLMLEPKFDEF